MSRSNGAKGGTSGIDVAIAGYRIDGVIGHGGMATVYRAQQLRLGRAVALKVIAPELAGEAAFRERFLREGLLAARLEHPHVVPVFDAGEDGGLLFIAMRYVPGSDLAGVLRRARGPLPAALAATLGEQLASGLDAADRLGLVHGDVKPANVLMGEFADLENEPHAYLSDFGLSHPIAGGSLPDASGGEPDTRVLGSINYIAPERIAGERGDARSDVYSLACLLYECLTGEPPFMRDSNAAALYAHLRAPRPPTSARAPRLPPALEDVLANALAVAPRERPASAGELAGAVAGALRGRRRSARSVTGRVASSPRSDAAGPSGEGERDGLVGRVREIATLLAALRRTLGGRGELVLLTGEAGIGKTALAEELCRQADRQGVPSVWGSAGAFGEAPPPYWHWLQIVRSLVRREHGERLLAGLGPSAAWLRAIAPELGGETESATEGAREGRFQIYDALAALLAGAAGRSGLVVVFDDLHVADEASLQALAYVATLTRESSVLLVGTYRDSGGASGGHRPAPPASRLTDIAASSSRIDLGALEPEQVGSLIAAQAGREASPELVGRLHDVSGGNPLFVSELVKLLVAEDGLPAAFADRRLPLPAAISDAIAARLAPLPPAVRDALSGAAVIGTSFRAGVLARATGTPPAELLALLDDAVGAGVVRASDEATDGYMFSHGLVRTSLYEAIPRTRLCALHSAVGEALERSYDIAAGEGLAEVAYHYVEAAPAGQHERAVDYAERAARRASSTYAYHEAVTLYRRALELLDAAPATRRLALLQALGEAQMRAGDTEGAKATLQRAAAAARAADDPAGLARAALASNIWGLSLGTDEPLVQLAEEAVERLEDDAQPGLLACVKGLLAAALYWSGETERRLRLADEALELARAEQASSPGEESTRMLAYVIGRCLLARWGPDSAIRDLDLSAELLDLAVELREPELEILTRNWRVTELLEMGRFADVDREIGRIEQMAAELRQPRAMVFLPLHHGSRAATAGRFVEAERLNAESNEIGRRVRGTVGELAATAQLLTIRMQQGRLAELEGPVRAIVGMHPGMIGMQGAIALMLVQTGRRAEGEAELERLLGDGLGALPFDNVHIATLALLGEVAAELNSAGRAADLHAWMAPYAGRWVVSAGASALWPVDRSLTRLATVAGDHEAAAAHLICARKMAISSGALPSVALAALDEARLLLAIGASDGIARVPALAREARELAQELGMGLVVDAATLLEASVVPASG